ncbi:hypothetical protein Pla123a_47100 [Posidoniimonas polymericola]|uniref:DUF4345 domain-containing protein n=1 Tax=Posidoniimonas polymericola TaxID=2528002 RepID=A0A5C5XST4_9BACT|nr:DUF4345 family protein [Posidoniimonas polymericola]TWT66316.1 hypothetical protein Pla123a_47100 [Posidoniimonas polymericola]
MLIARIYLALVGVLYAALAFYCSLKPGEAAQKVGFERLGDSGKSEFLTVYGGLEFGLALLLLAPVVRPATTGYALFACIAVHGSLVAFRAVSVAFYRDISPFTTRLAIGEWVIFLLSLGVWWLLRRSEA